MTEERRGEDTLRGIYMYGQNDNVNTFRSMLAESGKVSPNTSCCDYLTNVPHIFFLPTRPTYHYPILCKLIPFEHLRDRCGAPLSFGTTKSPLAQKSC
jgi:hypothetical protein